MKQTIIVFILILLPMLAKAETVEIDGIIYNLIEKGKVAEVTGNTIKNEWFVDELTLEEYGPIVVIPKMIEYEGVWYSVISIEDNAFYSSNLFSITIPNTVTSIGNKAFSSYLKQIRITDLEAWCKIKFGSASLSNSYHLYLNDSIVTHLVLPNTITSISSSAFSGCKSIVSVTIPNSVVEIATTAFDGCTKLEEVHVSDLTTWCNILFNSNPLNYAHHLFVNNVEVKDLVVPSSVTVIGKNTFSGCIGLSSVSLPHSITKIATTAFSGCTGLKEIHITDLASWCKIQFDGNPLIYAHHLYLNNKEVKNLIVPNSVTNLGANSFSGCIGLNSVTISNSVTSIGESTFSSCIGLSTVNIPNSVTSIGKSAFSGCTSLMSVVLGRGVKNIGSNSFANCPKITDIYCYAENVPNTNTDAFSNSYIEYATLHVPVSALDSYKAKAPWNSFKNIVATDGTIPLTPDPPKCATPTIAYKNGKLTFSCATEGVEYASEVTVADAKKYYTGEVNLGTTYKVSVVAMKTGYENSDAATMEINVGGSDGGPLGDLNGDGTVDATDITRLVQIVLKR